MRAQQLPAVMFCNNLSMYTPALQQAVMLLASPLMMLVALWGMSDVRELEWGGLRIRPPPKQVQGNSLQPMAVRTSA